MYGFNSRLLCTDEYLPYHIRKQGAEGGEDRGIVGHDPITDEVVGVFDFDIIDFLAANFFYRYDRVVKRMMYPRYRDPVSGAKLGDLAPPSSLDRIRMMR